jgi:hypothetical protein
MPTLAFDVSSDDLLNFGDAQSIERNLLVVGTKNMAPASDPSVDPSILRPEEAFRVE